MPFTFDNKIDLGHFLTFLTILGGIIAWFVSQWRERKREKKSYASSGALRLILRLLSDRSDPITSANDLFTQFQSNSLLDLRNEYCRYNFLYRDRRQFDAALYRLEEEGKLRFDGLDTVIFRQKEKISDSMNHANQMKLTENDTQMILATFYDGFKNLEISSWDLKDLTRVANRFSPNDVQNFLRNKISSANYTERTRAITLIEILV